MAERYKDADWLKNQINNGKTLSAIANEEETSVENISYFCKKFNIKKLQKVHHNKEWLYQKYVVENLSMKQIGEIAGVSRDMISFKLKQFDISKDNEKIVSARRSTMVEKYGAPTPLESEELLSKINNTKLLKYGTTNTSSLVSVKGKLPKYQNIFDHPANYWSIKYDIPRTAILQHFRSNPEMTRQEFQIFCENFKKKLSNIENYVSLKLQIDLWNKYFDIDLYKDFKYKPDFKIDGKTALNVDGLYWHSELNKPDKYYHFNMRKEYENIGLRIFQFREDEIYNNWNVICSIINNKNKESKRIFARKCTIAKVKTDDAKMFLSQNHLMGYISSNHYGLYYNNELVLIMSCKKNKNNLIIDRYCSKADYIIVGGFSKLLKFINENYTYRQIHYWVDLRYGTGYFLLKQGFRFERDVLGWKWTNFKDTFNRLRCRANMDDRMLSEKEYAEELGWVKIYDAGQRLYIMEYANEKV